MMAAVSAYARSRTPAEPALLQSFNCDWRLTTAALQLLVSIPSLTSLDLDSSDLLADVDYSPFYTEALSPRLPLLRRFGFPASFFYRPVPLPVTASMLDLLVAYNAQLDHIHLPYYLLYTGYWSVLAEALELSQHSQPTSSLPLLQQAPVADVRLLDIVGLHRLLQCCGPLVQSIRIDVWHKCTLWKVLSPLAACLQGEYRIEQGELLLQGGRSVRVEFPP